jgi:hypothetical protein
MGDIEEKVWSVKREGIIGPCVMEDINDVLENIGTKEVVRRSFRYKRELERGNVQHKSNKTLRIKIKSKHPKKGEYNEQNGRTRVQEDKYPPKRANHKENIKFLNPLLLKLLSQEAYQIRKGEDLLKGCPNFGALRRVGFPAFPWERRGRQIDLCVCVCVCVCVSLSLLLLICSSLSYLSWSMVW